MLAYKSRVGRKVKLFHAQKSLGKLTATTVAVGRREFRETIFDWPRPQLERLLNYRPPSHVIQVMVVHSRETWAQDRRIIWTRDLVPSFRSVHSRTSPGILSAQVGDAA